MAGLLVAGRRTALPRVRARFAPRTEVMRLRNNGLSARERLKHVVMPAAGPVVSGTRARQRVEMPMAETMQPKARMIVCHFIVSDDVERSARFYTEVLGGKVVFGPVPTNIELGNTYIIINTGGGPTDDKPTVTLETPSDPDRVSS